MNRRDRSIENQTRKLNFIFSCIATLFVACWICSCVSSCHSKEESPKPKTPTSTAVDNNAVDANLPSKAEFEDPDSILILVNKANPLTSDYEPNDLVSCRDLGITVVGVNDKMRKEAAEALKEMCDAAKKDGVDVFLGSGYRSYENQDSLWHSYANRDGAKSADEYSARAGCSEHQTGLCFDAAQGDGGLDGYNYTQKFEDTQMGKWLLENSWKHGFILRYPLNKESVTGYVYEPWHYRYIGKKWARYVHDAGQDMTYEEVFNLDGGQEYK